MQRVDLGIDWVGFAEDSVSELSFEAMNGGSYWTNKDLEESPYYTSAYQCPRCRDDKAVLHKLKVKEGIRFRAPKVFKVELGLWNIFTCAHCFSWFASLNYIDGVYDPKGSPFRAELEAQFTLKKKCLFSEPAWSYEDWQRCFKKTLPLARDW